MEKNPFKDVQEEQDIKADSTYQAHSNGIKMWVYDPFLSIS